MSRSAAFSPGNLQITRPAPFYSTTEVAKEETERLLLNTPAAVEQFSPNKTLIQQQLNLCQQVLEQDTSVNGEYITGRSRFHEHPRCTARFGEVISHAFYMASSSDERMVARMNAEAVIRYIGDSANGSFPVSEELISKMVQSLTAKSIRSFRIRQIKDYEADLKAPKTSDFIPEHNELELLGRLYYSAIKAFEPYLHHVGLSVDHGGFTVLLAMCRSAGLIHDNNQLVSKLDAAISYHFNGISAPGCRFLYSPRHGLNATNVVTGRSKKLIIAFSSLGNGLVRFEFGGSLAKLNKELYDAGKDTVDVLFVADPSQSWYTKDSNGQFDGFYEYEQRIRVASRPYDLISIVGDSMGGSAALLFSHLATSSVVAFSPQVNLNDDTHMSRNDMSESIREKFQRRVIENLKKTIGRGVEVNIHRGLEQNDIQHTNELMMCLSDQDPIAVAHVKIIEHPACSHHQIAVYLKETDQLVRELHVLAH